MSAARTATGLLLLSLTAGSAHALDPSRPPRNYERERWGAEQGFPGGAVYAIAQAADGYLWLGTERGLVRFDGREFRLLPRPEVPAGGPILGIVADADALWLRSDRPEILRYREGQFQSVPFATHPRELAPTAMVLGRGGQLLRSESVV